LGKRAAVHEIKHDSYRPIVRRDGPTVRLYTRNAYDWTARLPATAAVAGWIKAKSFTIDGEAVVLGPTACPNSMNCADRLPRALQSSMPST
jgi:bifunctional non-homologous end joining protein LigD